MHFRQKISFKSALESFASVREHLRTALTALPDHCSGAMKRDSLKFLFYIVDYLFDELDFQLP